MKVVVAIVFLLAVALCLPILIPVLTLGLVLTFVGGGFLIWLLPIIIIAASDRTSGAEKLAWILAIVFLSWFAWIFYFLLAPIKKEPFYRDNREYRYY